MRNDENRHDIDYAQRQRGKPRDKNRDDNEMAKLVMSMNLAKTDLTKNNANNG